MKKIIALLMLLVSLATANAKCDWSTLKLQQWSERNYYKWYVSGKVLDDTCVDYMFMIFKLKRQTQFKTFAVLLRFNLTLKVSISCI